MAVVYVTRTLPGNALQRLIDVGHTVHIHPDQLPPTPTELRRMAADADALITTLDDQITTALLDGAPRLKVVANYAVGADNIDVAGARRRDIAVGVTPDVLTDATADLTMALLLTVARHLPQATAAAKDGSWVTWEPARHLGLELRGARLVIVGCGRIGHAVAERAAAFGMQVLLVGRDDPLHEILAEADVLSLHVPLTPATRNLIGAKEFGALRPGALLVNTARGDVVDTEALLDALDSGQLAGAGLDVTSPEPLPINHPLHDHPNVVILPHIGSATTHARERMTELAVANVLAGLRNEPLPTPAP